MAQHRLTFETFLAVIEMVMGQLRIREADRWSPHVCRLKFSSFTGEFPEVNDSQFMWAAERWLQSLPPGFARLPTWKELMAPLYRTEGGQANRSWGFKTDLPAFLAPTGEQLRLLPSQPRSIAPVADTANSMAYALFTSKHRPPLPPASQQPRLSDTAWQEYLSQLDGTGDQFSRTQEDSGARVADREVVNTPVQRSPWRDRAKPGVPFGTPRVSRHNL